MSPAAKSRSKASTKAAKEQQAKTSPKPSASSVTGNGISASGYDPVLGTFHSLEVRPTASLILQQNNGRFGIMEDNSGSSSGTTTECDLLSNNGSCSGESEDQKEKLPLSSSASHSEPVPGADTDKQDKIRQKNERKHQRQRERRAQELHERCSGYLMSRKLEVLVQQLVAMGFTSERATVALMMNEGRLEESVSWLFDGGDESHEGEQGAGGSLDTLNLKIDITEEFLRMAEMEVRFKCTKQEVERAVIACEGNLEKAMEALKMTQKKDSGFAQQKVGKAEENNSPNRSSIKSVPSSATPAGTQVNVADPLQHLRKDDRDPGLTKPVLVGGRAVVRESASRNSVRVMGRVHPKSLDWSVSLGLPASSSSEKWWPNGSSIPSPAAYSSASQFQAAAPPSKSPPPTEPRESKTNSHPGTLREPIIVMQRPQSAMMNSSNLLPSTSLPAANTSLAVSSGRNSKGFFGMDPKSGNAPEVVGQNLTSLGINGVGAQPYYPQGSYRPFAPNPVDFGLQGGFRSWGSPPPLPTSSIATPSSLGLFTLWGSSASASGSTVSSSPVDWSTGSMVGHLDYNSIDWSLDAKHLNSDRLTERWSTIEKAPSLAAANSVGGFKGFKDSASFLFDSDKSVSVVPCEWTSPFAGKDLFRFHRQFVTSPSQ